MVKGYGENGKGENQGVEEAAAGKGRLGIERVFYSFSHYFLEI
jgi:hypothetical protein